MAKKLNLKIEPTRIKLLGVESSQIQSNGVVTIALSHPNEHLEEKFVVVNKISPPLPNQPITIQNYEEFHSLPLADPNYGTPKAIDALFGINIWVKIIQNGTVKTKDGLFAAQKTLFGWIIFKREVEFSSSKKIALHATKIAKEENFSSLLDLMERFWKIEDMPSERHLSFEEQECENIFTRTIQQSNEGRYIVNMPLNGKIRLLGKSKTVAIRQFLSIERKMRNQNDFRDNYHDFMLGFEQLGHMRKISDHMEEGYYTPHHGVLSSKKFRVVFNASCVTTTGISLNDCQLVGAKLQKDLAEILMSFRSYRIALTADIVKMYRQVEITEEHRKYQKIIWRYSPNEPLGVYEINRVMYGQAAAPFLAVRAMQHCACEYEKLYPKGATAILNDFYIDDALTGAESIREAKELKSEMIKLLQKGNFELSKWCSNMSTLTNDECPEYLQIQDEEIKTVLGLRWLPRVDKFIFHFDPKPDKANWSKRDILSEIGRLYDPNGYLGPIVITAKMLMQQIWQEKYDWDDLVSETINTKWKMFLSSLDKLNLISIPRWLGMTKWYQSELHVFSDASEKAYAAVVYVRTQTNHMPASVQLVQSKTRVAPLKIVTIPRLELCGAHLAVKLAMKIQKEFPTRIMNIFFWTDSEIVLHWLKKKPHELKTFVGNRVSSIHHELREISHHWKWISGETNPADLASRGVNTERLATSKLWWNGPKWLSKEMHYWPIPRDLSTQSVKEVDLELKSILHISKGDVLTRNPWYLYSRNKFNNVQFATPLLKTYGSFTKLKRVTALILRAANNFKAHDRKRTGPISKNELKEATTFLVKLDQEDTFSREIGELRLRNSPRTIGTMWLDQESNVLRLYGRVQSENLTRDEQYPILLSQNGDLAPLIIHEAHLKTLHGGVQQVLQLIRQKYWIQKSRQLSRKIINRCLKCFKAHPRKLLDQLMSPLPTERTTRERPFKVCGVDYAGPVGLSSKTGRNPVITKAYIAVFVCFATRAVHLELVSGLDTDHFLQALRRLIARRGPIATIYSDNGLNFVGANNFLKEIYHKQSEWATGKVPNMFNITWKFITPHAPHQGGLHEAAVKSAKKHLYKIIGEQKLTYEEYSTLLTQVEACVNSRPLCPMSDDPNDLVALTPAHFLIGEPLVTLVEPDDLTDVNQWRLKRWELLQQMYQHWWQRWQTEYLNMLSQRPKWTNKNRNVEINDLVVIKEQNIGPSEWNYGRVIKTQPGPDGLVRSITLRTIHGEYRRPITKLAIFLTNKEVEEMEQAYANVVKPITSK